MSILVYFIFIMILLLINTPIAFALIIPSVIYFIFSPGFSLNTVSAVLFNAPNSFPLLAVPLFILLGSIMNTGGITDKIFCLCRRVVGHFSGGIAYSNVLASVIFSGMSGSALADTAGLGMVEIKAMSDNGYDLDFACAVTGASAVIGPIFPPSVPLILYGVIAQVSIGRLLAGGMLPGLLIAVILVITIYYMSIKAKYPKEQRASLKEIFLSFLESFPALFTIVIILSGILFGIVTPTEAAILGVMYSLFLVFVVYREMKFEHLIKNIRESAYTVCSFMLVVAGAFLFSRIITLEGISTMLSNYFISVSQNSPYLFLLMINVLLLIVGCFMEGAAALIIFTPILLPVAIELGINPVHLGVIIVFNLMIGLFTPPMGIGLYVLTRIAHIPFKKVCRAMFPFYVSLIFTLILVTYLPFIVLYLPNLFFSD